MVALGLLGGRLILPTSPRRKISTVGPCPTPWDGPGAPAGPGSKSAD